MIQLYNFFTDYYFLISGLFFVIFYSILLYINKNEFKKKNYSIFTPIFSSFIFSFGLFFNIIMLFYIIKEYIIK